MDERTYKQQVIDSAIQGLIDGGTNKLLAENYRVLFYSLYTLGYKEGMRRSQNNDERTN